MAALAMAEAQVRAFCASWSGMDVGTITAFMAPDIVWENVPIGVTTGRTAVARRLSDVFARASAMHWDVVELAVAPEGAVLTERIDHIRIGDRVATLRVMGIFRVGAQGITLWRDYFDLEGYRRDLGPAGWA